MKVSLTLKIEGLFWTANAYALKQKVVKLSSIIRRLVNTCTMQELFVKDALVRTLLWMHFDIAALHFTSPPDSLASIYSLLKLSFPSKIEYLILTQVSVRGYIQHFSPTLDNY